MHGITTQEEREMVNKERLRSASLNILLKRCGLDCRDVSSDIMHNFGLSEGASLTEVCRAFLSVTSNNTGSGTDLIVRAMTTSDFPSLLSNLAEKILQSTYQNAPSTWKLWTSKGSLNNFKPSQISGVYPPGLLFEIKESGEYKRLKLTDAGEVVRLSTFGGIAPISRHAIVNDDLDALKDMARMLSVTAMSTIARQVYGLLLSNPVMSDDKEAFTTDHNNLLAGADSALGRDSLAAGLKLMRSFTNPSGIPLAVEPKFLLVPPSLEMTAHELCYSDSVPGQSNSNVLNLFKKIGLTPIVEPLLESPILEGSSSSAWYLLPDPELWPNMRVYGLGTPEIKPYLESKTAWNNDALENKVRVDVGCAMIGRFGVKSKGV